MTTREIASEYRLVQWAEKMRDQKDSGQNIRQWCEANGIKQQRYYYWQRKLRQSACEQLIKSHGDGMQAGLSTPTAFTQVKLAPSMVKPESSGSDHVRIEVQGVQITAGSGYPAEQLARLVRELTGTC